MVVFKILNSPQSVLSVIFINIIVADNLSKIGTNKNSSHMPKYSPKNNYTLYTE